MTESLSPTLDGTTGGARRPRAWWLVYIPLIILFIFAVAPLFLTWFTAFKTDQQQLASPYGLPLPPTLDNLREAWTVGRFSIYFKNSLVISIADVIGMVLISSLAGYAFARLHFPGQKILLYVLLIGLTIPVAAIIIPLYLTMRDFRLLNTYGSVIVADIALAAPIFGQIMLPLARPGLMTVALLEFLWSWNDLLLPLVFLVTDDLRTLPVGMLFFQGRFTIDYGLMSAGVLIISLPVTILFLVFQRDFVKGLASGALKG